MKQVVNRFKPSRRLPHQCSGGNISLIDDNQNVLVRYEYDVFGTICSETGTSDNSHKFTGKEFDVASNLYYFAARYDLYIGCFTQRDLAEDDINWYADARKYPLKFIDSTGLRARGVNAREACTGAGLS